MTDSPKTIRDIFRDIDSKKLTNWLKPFVGRKQPLFLPSAGDLQNAAEAAYSESYAPSSSARVEMLLAAHLKVLAVPSSAKIICCLPDAHGNTCGGLMDIAVDVHGSFYQCTVDPKSHRIPV